MTTKCVVLYMPLEPGAGSIVLQVIHIDVGISRQQCFDVVVLLK